MAKPEFAIANLNGGQLNAVVKNLMAQIGINDPVEAVRRFNAGEYTLVQKVPRWSVDAEGNLIFEVTSDGTSGPEWITRIESKGLYLGDNTKSILLSKDFKPTTSISYKLIAIKATAFEKKERISKSIRSHAKKAKWQTPNAEIACLITEKFSYKEIEEMGIWYLITMHKSIKDSNDLSILLNADREGGRTHLHGSHESISSVWNDRGAFVFTLSQASSLEARV